MKEVLTKSFWLGVKKTFYDALEGASQDDKAPPSRAEFEPNTSSGTETSSPLQGSPATPDEPQRQSGI
jgi:hypothetical protein